MYISNLTSYNINAHYNANYKRQCCASIMSNGVDTFERSNKTNFCGHKIIAYTKNAEDTYKDIDGVHDPYSDVLMISRRKFKSFKQKVPKRPNCESMLKLIAENEQHLFEPEKEVFEMISQYYKNAKSINEKDAKHLTFADAIQSFLPEAKANIKPEQHEVINKMENISKKMSDKSQAFLQPIFDVAREQIEQDTFRIQPLTEALMKVSKNVKEKKMFEDIYYSSYLFPSSATSTSALIIKYADKSHEQIAVAMLKPALVSIEHIRPHSKRGASSPKNYIAASTRMNNLRKSMPLDKFVMLYPNIPDQMQRYFDDLILKINRGGLRSIASSLFDVKKTIYSESDKLIDINLDALNPSFIEEHRDIHSHINKLIDQYAKK